ncbi:hypothetical protein AGMMS49574_26140 [Bacteroidia bacterium]|nr:hypothetical protein AGMMS49574_26140 [Bacteroidia bacterium]
MWGGIFNLAVEGLGKYLAPPVIFSLEDALEYIKIDEYVEITPSYMRMRKIVLDELERKRQNR